MAKKPRPTKGVPEEVFQRELFKYLERKESNPNALRNQAHFTYNGIQYTFERGNGPYHSGYQIKTSSGQAAKEASRNGQKNNTKLSEGEKLFRQNLYDIASERNIAEGRTGSNKLEVDHLRALARDGPDHPAFMRLMERGENGRKSADIDYYKYKYEPLLPSSGLQNLIDAGQQALKRGATKIARNAVPYAGTTLDAQDTAQRFDEFKQKPNGTNGAQLAVQGLSTAANFVGDLALSTGVGAPIAAGAEKVAGLMTLTDAFLQGAEDLNNRSGRP